MFVDRSLKINSILKVIAYGQNLISPRNHNASCLRFKMYRCYNNQQCYCNHSHIITSQPFVFSLMRYFFSSNFVISLCFLLLVILLITDTKWFIKISLRTRYMLVCGQILNAREMRKTEREGMKKKSNRRAWKITFVVVFNARPNGQARKIRFVSHRAEPTGKLWSIHHHSKRNFFQFYCVRSERNVTGPCRMLFLCVCVCL